jgi:hypothetical protein
MWKRISDLDRLDSMLDEEEQKDDNDGLDIQKERKSKNETIMKK